MTLFRPCAFSLVAVLAANCTGTVTPADGGDAAAPPADSAHLDARTTDDGALDVTALDAADETPSDLDVALDITDATTDTVPADVASARDSGPRADSGCHLPPATADSLAPMRQACTFAAGAHIAGTLADPATIAAARAAIQHVFVIMQENHSLDTYFGHTGRGIEGVPAGYTNPDANGNPVAPHHFANACPCDITHSFTATTSEWDNGRMDGFLRTDGTGALGYFTDDDHPFYTWMITTFATSDRYFCALLDSTGHNRQYFYQGSAVGGASTLFDSLDRAGVPWGDYVAGYALAPDGSTLTGGNNLQQTYGHRYMLDHTHPITDLYTGLTSGALPPVVYIDVGLDEHPGDNGQIVNVHAGESAVRNIVTRLFASPLWAHSALVMTYDEGGGFFDHVPPPSACVATTSAVDTPYTHYGVRVPLFVVSPYARASYVSHQVHSHTSVLRFVEMLHDLPALSRRDANADALLDLFDFGCPTFPTAPAPASVPPAGTPTAPCAACVR